MAREYHERDQELVAILTTSEVTLLPVVQSMLDAADVPYLIQGGEALGLLPLGPFSAGMFGDSLGASVLVPRSRVEEALELLRGCNIHEAGD